MFVNVHIIYIKSSSSFAVIKFSSRSQVSFNVDEV